MIAAWAAYLPLDEVVRMEFLTSYCKRHQDSATVSVYFTRHGLSRDVVVSEDLFYETERAALAFHREFGPSIPHQHWGKVFLKPANCQPFTSAEFFAAVDAASQF